MSENLPATVSSLPELPQSRFTDQQIDSVSKGSEFLPRLAVCGSNSDLVKEGKVPMGHLALIFTKDRYVDLGTETNVLSLVVRPKALRIGAEGIFNYFDPNSEDFKGVQRDSMTADSGCMYGPEFLVYLPEQDEFASFYMSSKSARREAPNLLAIMTVDGKRRPMPATIKSKFIPKSAQNKYSWHTPQVQPCSAQLSEPPEDFTQRVLDEVEKFNNPPTSKVEKIQEGDSGRVV